MLLLLFLLPGVGGALFLQGFYFPGGLPVGKLAGDAEGCGHFGEEVGDAYGCAVHFSAQR